MIIQCKIRPKYPYGKGMSPLEAGELEKRQKELFNKIRDRLLELGGDHEAVSSVDFIFEEIEDRGAEPFYEIDILGEPMFSPHIGLCRRAISKSKKEAILDQCERKLSNLHSLSNRKWTLEGIFEV